MLAHPIVVAFISHTKSSLPLAYEFSACNFFGRELAWLPPPFASQELKNYARNAS